MATLVQDVAQALKNLGGQARLVEIYAEVERIRTVPLPVSWQANIREAIESHSADSMRFRGRDYFRKVDTGVWALRDGARQPKPMPTPPPYPTPQPPPKPIGVSPTHPGVNPISIEQVENCLNTIREYRMYAQPGETSWKEYVEEFFNVLGFSMESLESRLYRLHLIGTQDNAKALVCFVEPGENFNEIVPGLEWEKYMEFAAAYYQLSWGILTNGLELKTIQFEQNAVVQNRHWHNLDGIIQANLVEPFFEMYKFFADLQGETQPLPQSHAPKQENESEQERHRLRIEFWTQLLANAKGKTELHSKTSPQIHHWLSTSAGKRGIEYNYVVLQEETRIEVYISRSSKKWNKAAYQSLLGHKAEIESIFGAELEWQELPDKKACRIRYTYPNFGIRDQEHWGEMQDYLIDGMIRLEKAFSPYIRMID